MHHPRWVKWRAVATLSAGPAPLSSRGLGRRPLTAETGVRIPVAVPHAARLPRRVSLFLSAVLHSRKTHRTGPRVYAAGRQGPVATTRVGGYARQRDPRGRGEGPRTAPACSRRRDPSTPKGAVYAWTKVARGSDRGRLDRTTASGDREVGQSWPRPSWGPSRSRRRKDQGADQCDCRALRTEQLRRHPSSSDPRGRRSRPSVVSAESGSAARRDFLRRPTPARLRGEFVAVLGEEARASTAFARHPRPAPTHRSAATSAEFGANPTGHRTPRRTRTRHPHPTASTERRPRSRPWRRPPLNSPPSPDLLV